MYNLSSPRSLLHAVLEGPPSELSSKLLMESECNPNNGNSSPRIGIIGNVSPRLGGGGSPRVAGVAKSTLPNIEQFHIRLYQEKVIATSLIKYIQNEQAGKRFQIPKTAEDTKASQICISLMSNITKDVSENPQEQIDRVIKKLQSHITGQIDPVINRLEDHELAIIEQLSKKIAQSNSKNEKLSEVLTPIRKFNRSMLEAYLKGIRDGEDLNSSLFQTLTDPQKKAVVKMIAKKHSLKAYIEQSSSLTMQTLEHTTQLGADFNRHVPYVHIYDHLDRPLLQPFIPNIDLNLPDIKLRRIQEWILVFCDQCGLADPLKGDVLNKWQNILNRYENDKEIVSKSAQFFFDDILNLAKGEYGFFEENRNLMRKLAHCLALISQKLYSDPGVCVGQITKPDGYVSAYADVPDKKAIKIKFDSKGGIEALVSIEKEVNARMRGEGGKKEFNEFPNVRLQLINHMYSNHVSFDQWESDFSLIVGVERIRDPLGLPTIPTDVYKKVIQPLTKAGFVIEHLYSY